MTEFTPIASTLGGILIGLAVAALFFLNGKILGVSNITAGLLDPKSPDKPWRIAFVGGLLAGGLLLLKLYPAALNQASTHTIPSLMIAGLLVGFGASLGRGCTSGHGVCGISRLSGRSLLATGVFIAAGIITVYITHHLTGGL